MPKVDIAGLKVDALTHREFLEQLADRLGGDVKTFVTTPYSEFLYAVLHNPEVRDMLNRSDIAIPDGIGILWARRFLSAPLRTRGRFVRWLGALWQMVYTGAEILLYPSSLYRDFPAKIVGADVVWDVAKLAADQGYKMYLLGGFGKTTERAATKLRQRYPDLPIVGTSNKNPDETEAILSDMRRAQPDILLVAFGPLRQEQWIVDNYDKLSVRLVMGVGGTFDYLAGSKLPPPRFIRKIGLEWLYRLFTQPNRAGRIKNATLGLAFALVRYKVAKWA